jgi:hypothetical protein
MATLLERAIGVARLDVPTYEEIEADQNALGQAMTVVAIASVANGIGSAAAQGGHGLGLIGGIIAAGIGWLVWTFTIYLIGTRLLPEANTKSDFNELLRVTGFAMAPGAAGILGILPGIGGLVLAIVGLWQIAAMVVGVRQALDYTSTGRAVAVCVIGFIAQMAAIFLIMGVLIGGVLAIAGGGSPATVTP